MSEIGNQAKEIAKKKLLDQCKRVRLTPMRVLKRISEGLDATEVKAHYDKDRGKWAYSTPLVDHGHRLEAAELGVMLHDMKPAGKLDVDVTGNMADMMRQHLAGKVDK